MKEARNAARRCFPFLPESEESLPHQPGLHSPLLHLVIIWTTRTTRTHWRFFPLKFCLMLYFLCQEMLAKLVGSTLLILWTNVKRIITRTLWQISVAIAIIIAQLQKLGKNILAAYARYTREKDRQWCEQVDGRLSIRAPTVTTLPSNILQILHNCTHSIFEYWAWLDHTLLTRQ